MKAPSLLAHVTNLLAATCVLAALGCKPHVVAAAATVADPAPAPVPITDESLVGRWNENIAMDDSVPSDKKSQALRVAALTYMIVGGDHKFTLITPAEEIFGRWSRKGGVLLMQITGTSKAKLADLRKAALAKGVKPQDFDKPGIFVLDETGRRMANPEQSKVAFVSFVKI